MSSEDESGRPEYLFLKRGTLKGWRVKSVAGMAILEQYVARDKTIGVMDQNDTPEQKELICQLIDVVDGPIRSDWTGDVLGKEEAKKYIREYRSWHA